MRKFDIFIMGLRNLFRRKTRTILTVMGVVIGTAAIVVMVSLGLGMNERYDAQVKQMGSLNIINVNKYRKTPNPNGKEIVIDDKTVASIKTIKGVKAVTPVVESYGKLVSGKYIAYAQILGIDSASMEGFDYKLAQGRLLQEGDTDSIVAGFYIPQQFYNPKNMYGNWGGNQTPSVDILTDKLELTFDMNYGEKRRQDGMGGSDQSGKPPKLYKIKGVGTLTQTNDWQKDGYIFMDLNHLQKLIKDASKAQQGQNQGGFFGGSFGSSTNKGYERLMVFVENYKEVDKIQAKIDDMGYGTNSLADVRKEMQKQSQTLQIVLGGLGAISLLISALGITNTMIMSIYERTREIGVMKVLGCEMKNIKQLFLFESGVIGLFGGIVGIILSYIASFILNSVGINIMNSGDGMGMGMSMSAGMGMNSPGSRISVIPPWLALFAVVFAILIGLISGFSPARRAMKLSALEAIKTE